MKYYKEYVFYVYILFDERAKGTYIGMTNDLQSRILTHKQEITEGFTKQKHVHKLGYYEVFQYVDDAIKREKQLKKWKRAWKYRLIETMNPEWKDLAEGINWMIDYRKNVRDFLEKVDSGQLKVV